MKNYAIESIESQKGKPDLYAFSCKAEKQPEIRDRYQTNSAYRTIGRLVLQNKTLLVLKIRSQHQQGVKL